MEGRSGPLGPLFDSRTGQSLGYGVPSDEILRRATAAYKEASIHSMSQESAIELMMYGSRFDPFQPFCQSLARFLTREFGEQVFETDLLTNCGATDGVRTLASQFSRPGDVVFVEELTFAGAKWQLEQAGLRIVPVPLDEDGVLTDELEVIVERELGGKESHALTDCSPFRALFYTIPVYHNPTGYCLSKERAKEVVRIARKHDLLVICDDVYHLLPLTEKKHRRLFAYDSKDDPNYKGHVVSNATFSKIFAPGLRLGWMEAPKRVRDIIAESAHIKSGGAPNHCATGIMASAIQLGLLDDLLLRAKAIYKENASALCDIFDRGLPSCIKYKKPQGGFFIWMKLPESIAAKDISISCLRQNVKVFPGNFFSVHGDFKNYLRIAFSHLPKEKVIKEAEIVVECIRESVESRK
ncbi:2-aminoadipate transaminase-like [Oscarella lobularis]|uniref:2-aminoadipate transaminase-like n=1 Tax=Oscarella lobularis TaxID=121494 RepID=UPI0033141F76